MHQISRFIIVGILNTAVGYAFYSFFIYVGMNYLFAVLCSMLLGILFNFKTTGTLVFNNRNNVPFLRFVLVYTVIFFCNILFIRGMQLFTINLYIAGFFPIIPSAIISFLLNKWFVFRDVYEIN